MKFMKTPNKMEPKMDDDILTLESAAKRLRGLSVTERIVLIRAAQGQHHGGERIKDQRVLTRAMTLDLAYSTGRLRPIALELLQAHERDTLGQAS